MTEIPIFFLKNFFIPYGKHHDCEPGEGAVEKSTEDWALSSEEAQEMAKDSQSKLWSTGGISSSPLGGERNTASQIEIFNQRITG